MYNSEANLELVHLPICNEEAQRRRGICSDVKQLQAHNTENDSSQRT